MRKFGIKMDGCEEALEAHIKKTHSQFKPSLEDEGLPFCFCEVGFADGVTHKAVRDILVETGDTNFITLGLTLRGAMKQPSQPFTGHSLQKKTL
jgi:hypothetical protein